MNYLNGQNNVEVKEKRYKIPPDEYIILGKRHPPKSFRTQNQVQNATITGKNQKRIKNDKDELKGKRYPKKKKLKIEKAKVNLPSCRSCDSIFGLNLPMVIVNQAVNLILIDQNINELKN